MSNGEFGERLIDHARRFQLKFDVVANEWGRAFDLETIRAALDATPKAGWLWCTHCETSSGVLNDLTALKSLCAARGVRLCVDSISTVGTLPVDLRGVFMATATSGKGLRGYPGLALVFHHHELKPAPEELPRHLVMMAASDRPKSWSGGKIRRRRLFLRAERNFVEQMVFARFLADVARDSRHVLAECDEAALPLLKMAFPDVGFAASGKLAPSDLAAHRVQVAASLGDLSSLYQQTAGAWLPYDPALSAAHRRRSRRRR